ncbi:MAG: ABC transporter ATP-binding protein [Pseudomonadota bacterium]
MTEIHLDGISKSFGETTVLERLDLAIRPGEFLTLVGPSGCGKSTLLRILAGLERQTAGHVRIGGRVVDDVRAADRDLAMVFQSYALYPHLTVAENMLTPLRLRDLSFAERLPYLGPLLARGKYRALRQAVQEVAEILKIEALLARKPGQLSGGQRQRAALGRAMVRNPVAFLMDEPLSNLDAALRVHMRSELRELHRRLRATFVYVTHDQAEALTMSDRMAVMMDGQILQLGAPQEVYDDPAHLKVATFVGSPKINTLPGMIDAEGGVTRLGLPLGRRIVGAAPGPVTIALRPEHLRLRPTAGPEAISGRLTHIENLGADLWLHIAIGDGAHRIIARAEHEMLGTCSLGDIVHVERLKGEALVFGADGARLRFEGEAAPSNDAGETAPTTAVA